MFNLPNFLTCSNLLCGCMGIVAVFHGDLLLASWLIGVACIFDFFDGFAARLLKINSELGKQLDSLADVVTFGVLPACIIFSLMTNALPDFNSLWKAYFAFLIVIFSALRLAKFNIDARQAESFIGVPTPANAVLIGSLPLIQRYNPEIFVYFNGYLPLLSLTVLMSILLVAELPLFALKFKQFGWKGNEIKYIFVLFSVFMLFFLKFVALPLIIIGYVALSITHRFSKIKK